MRRDERGVTMIEMALVVALFIVVLAASLDTLTASWKHGSNVGEQTRLQGMARLAVDELVPDLKQAYTGDAAMPPVAVATGSTLTFYTPNRSAPYRLRKISYRLQGSALQRSVTTSTDNDGAPWVFPADAPYVTVADKVTLVQFTGRDAAGAVTTVPGAMRRVEVELRLDVNIAPSPEVQRFQTTVDLRVIR